MREFMQYLGGLGVLGGRVLGRTGKEAEKATRTGQGIGLQHDAAEILVKVLERLGPSAEVMTPMQSTLTPVGGGDSTITPARNTVLTLPISSAPAMMSIADELARYCTRETVDYQGGKYYKHFQFAALPKVLTIALNRFAPTPTQGTAKNTWPVVANLTLEIPDVCLSPYLKALLGGRRPTYRLEHFVHHSGAAANSGHYTSYGKLPGTAAWYKHDDVTYLNRRTLPTIPDLAGALSTGYIYVYVRNPLPPVPLSRRYYRVT
jgi:ubiquitin C-terminal hydrolase